MFKLITSLIVICIAVSTIDARWGWGHGSGWWINSGNLNNLPTQCNVNPSKGYYNGTYFNYYTSASQCCADCISNSTCASFSYNKRESSPCYQVGASTVFVSDSRYTSGLVSSTVTAAPVTVAPVTTVAPTVTRTCSVIQTNIEYRDNDLSNAITSDYAGCCTLCGNTVGCNAWTWSQMTNTCFLKTARGTQLSVPFGMTSGLLDSVTVAPVTVTVAPVTTSESACFVEINKSYASVITSILSTTTVADLSACCNSCGASNAVTAGVCGGFTFTSTTLSCVLVRPGFATTDVAGGNVFSGSVAA